MQRVRSLCCSFQDYDVAMDRLNRAIVHRVAQPNAPIGKSKLQPQAIDYQRALKLDGMTTLDHWNLEALGLRIGEKGLVEAGSQGYAETILPDTPIYH